MNPFLVLPEEMWRMIFDEVESPEDLLSVREAHPEFRRILNETRTSWMFKRVFPHLVKHLATTDVLVSRQVCQRWNKTIFQFFEQHPTIQRPHLSGDLAANNILQIREGLYPAQRLFQGYPLTPQSVQELHDDPDKRQFLREHPILGRHVYLRLQTFEIMEDEEPNNADEEEEEEPVPIRLLIRSMNIHLMEAVLDELKESTWFLSIDAFPRLEEGHFYNNFVTCLKHLPNLKCVIPTGRSYSTLTETELEVNENLPALPYLESIIVNGSLCRTFTKVLRFLYQTYEAQLKNVKISSGAFWEVHHSKDRAVLDNLERLELWSNYVDRDDFFPSEKEGLDYELYDTWKRLSCPVLQILKLDVQELKMRTVFQILQSCPSLVVLKIYCQNPIPEVFPELEEGFQGPQNLKVLEVSDAAFVAENFLGKVPSVEVVVLLGCHDKEKAVENAKPLRIKMKSALRFTPEGSQIYASNIWKLLPRLKKFHAVSGNGLLNDPVANFVYTRETYESLQNLKGVE